MRDLQNTKQKYNESFAEYLTRWREKLGQMRHRPTEIDQLIIFMEFFISVLSKKLGDLRIRNFEELYRFGVQKESDLVQEKKFFSGRTENINTAGPSNNMQINAIRPPSRSFQYDPFSQPNSSYQFNAFSQLCNSTRVNAIRQPPRKFSNLGRPLSKILEKLIEKNLLRPMYAQQPLPNANPKVYCKFH